MIIEIKEIRFVNVLSILVLLSIIFGIAYYYFGFSYYDFVPLGEVKSNITNPVYIALYIGDIDGAVSDDWYPFYNQIIDFHEENKIPLTISFYPATIQDDVQFNRFMARAYNSKYIELMQKGNTGNETEMRMAELPYEIQYSIIKAGQDHYRTKMAEILGINESQVKVPTDYNQIGASFSNETLKVAESLGFNFYFDIYTGEDVKSVKPTNTFDVTEYGVSFTTTGEAGNEFPFNTPNKILKDINSFSREDLKTIDVNGIPFIPMWAHQQDFENKRKENILDKRRWEIYTKTVLALQKDPNVYFITPSEAYALRHGKLSSVK